MQTVTLDEAQKHLAQLVRDLGREGELLITDADKPVARLSAITESADGALIHPEVEAITGLVPEKDDLEKEYRKHQHDKHR